MTTLHTDRNISCETVLLGLCDDALFAVEKQRVVRVTIIDLSAAFYTVDHDILFHVMENEFGFIRNILKWLETI